MQQKLEMFKEKFFMFKQIFSRDMLPNSIFSKTTAILKKTATFMRDRVPNYPAQDTST